MLTLGVTNTYNITSDTLYMYIIIIVHVNAHFMQLNVVLLPIIVQWLQSQYIASIGKGTD